MPEIRYLSSLEVFAVRVSVTDTHLQVKILALSEDFEPGQHTLYSEDGEAFTVLMEQLELYNVELPRIHALPV